MPCGRYWTRSPTRAMPSRRQRGARRVDHPGRRGCRRPCRGPRMRWNATCARCRASPTCRSRNRCRARTADPPARGRSGAGGRHRRVDRHGGAHRHRGRHQCQFGALQLRGPAGARARAAARARTGRPAGAGQSARLDRQRRDGGAAQRRGHRIRQRPARIERSARLRRISVDADLSGTTLGTALEAIDALPALRERRRRAPDRVRRRGYMRKCSRSSASP